MTATEKLVLIELAKSLKSSTSNSWPTGYGDLDMWTTYAKQMKNVILTAVPIMEKLVSEENPTQPGKA
jgi:hypothetical protein